MIILLNLFIWFKLDISKYVQNIFILWFIFLISFVTISILLENNFNIVEEIVYPDHYNYKKNDIIEIKKRAKKIGANIITTEKDFIKLSYKEKKNINFLKVNLKIKNEKDFINFLKLKIHEKN